ncbi:TetR/AcrR family transcriptional regulator [Thalassomonas haliotis]|uniref:TetR/AcrR family transcriptional regulator n=1 Tax=Thalassomonas haliotis TaxID=485448 RepID=A0ABY7V9L5_9GAMM|nr:TetR/AcrR family transcriptional regulator [Thalassomonas haliotis]WDE09975.1 TetR/AcrR family transcriptional regulator [Thalassomonas haliotis]
MAGGRKLEFDKQQALEAAMQVFWQKGYLGASLSDLTSSMGINKPSMYSTFGNKEKLFLQATEYYIEHHGKSHLAFLSLPDTSLRIRLRKFLNSVISAQFENSNPKGCYVMLCMTEAASGDMPEQARELISEAAGLFPALLEALFKQDKEAISLGLDKNAKSNALTLATLLNGTAAMARADYCQADLQPVIDNTLNGIGL